MAAFLFMIKQWQFHRKAIKTALSIYRLRTAKSAIWKGGAAKISPKC